MLMRKILLRRVVARACTMPELVAGQRGVAQDNSGLQAHVAMVSLARYRCGAPSDRGRLAKMR